MIAWSEAQGKIERAIRPGLALGRDGSSAREVVEINHACRRNGYGGEPGFEVRIGVTSDETLDIPWSMLKTCYEELVANGYDAAAFRRHYARQARIHPCHVHVVGMLFVRSGLATSDRRVQARYTPAIDLPPALGSHRP